MSIPLIKAAQTAAKQPLNETLLDALRQRSTLVPLGTIIAWYDYQGLIQTPEGFMRLSGLIVNETNYNAQHAGRGGLWAEEIGTSPLLGKHLPDLTDKYLVFGDETHHGNIEVPTVGNEGNVLPHHTHGLPTHNHLINCVPPSSCTSRRGGGDQDRVYNAGGNLVLVQHYSHTAWYCGSIREGASSQTYFGLSSGQSICTRGTSNCTLTSSSTQSGIDLKPHSIVAQAWIRII